MKEKASKIKDLGLSNREKLVVHHLISGQTAKSAVKLAGYADGTKSNQVTSRDRVRLGVLLSLESAGLGIDTITATLKEGLKSTKLFGTYDDFIEIADYPTRLKYCETIIKLADLNPEQNQTLTVETVEQKLARLYGSVR